MGLTSLLSFVVVVYQIVVLLLSSLLRLLKLLLEADLALMIMLSAHGMGT